MDNTTAAYIAAKKFANDYRNAYIAKATESQRNAKHFDIGCDGYYNGAEHLALLAAFGFNSVDEFQEAVEKTEWMIAFNKFNQIQSMLTYKSNEYNTLWTNIKKAGFYDEEDHNMDGLAMYAIAKAAAPKYAQLIELTTELGLNIPHNWKN